MTEQTVRWYDLGEVSQVPVRGARRVVIDDQPIGIFRTLTDDVYAIEDRCPHKQGPLSDGIVHDNCVTCPLHNWVIDLTSGQAQGADEGGVHCYPLKLVDGRIHISVVQQKTAETSVVD